MYDISEIMETVMIKENIQKLEKICIDNKIKRQNNLSLGNTVEECDYDINMRSIEDEDNSNLQYDEITDMINERNINLTQRQLIRKIENKNYHVLFDQMNEKDQLDYGR
jgi:hypothetical protein